MTDRHAAYIVTLSEDIREDDAEESILVAIRMIKGVASVKPVLSDQVDQQIAAERRDIAWRHALLGLSKTGPGALESSYLEQERACRAERRRD